MVLLWLLACGEAQPCGQYEDPAQRGWCMSRRVNAGEAPLSACSEAGPYADHCRARWVEDRLPDPTQSFETLLAACGGAPDCQFLVLDARPHAELGEQMRRCARWAGPYLDSCQIHAAQAWSRALPDEEAVQRALNDPEAQSWSGPLAAALGYRARCQAVPCAQTGSWQTLCEDALRHLPPSAELCSRP